MKQESNKVDIMGIKNKWSAVPRKKKIQAIIAAAFSAALVVGMPVLAWFTQQRQTATVIQINAPTTINIKSGNEEPVEMIDLSNINVQEYLDPTDPETLVSYGEYVFCITGKYLSYYDIQIARTTNIDFDYELYRVNSGDFQVNDQTCNVLTGIDTDPGAIANHAVAEYKSELDEKTYYYPYKTANATSTDKTQGNVTNLGSFLNDTVSGGQTVGDGSELDDEGKSFHDRNYGDEDSNGNITAYSNVNVYAEPLYWQVKNLPVTGQIGDSGFVDYYVLKIKWDGKGLTNNKETDMIYITARKSVN